MPIHRIGFMLLFGLLLIAGAALAGPWNKKTLVSFRETVELPAGVVLPPGDYVMELQDSPSNRHIVQVFSADERKLHGTVLATPTQRSDPADKTIITFYETPSGDPLFINSWFYPGDTVGQQFTYPGDRAYRISRATGSHVPIHPASGNGPVEIARPGRSARAARAPVQRVRATPSSHLAEAQTLDPDSHLASKADYNQLPQTTGHEGLIIIAGLSALAAALALRLLWRQTGAEVNSSGPPTGDNRSRT